MCESIFIILSVWCVPWLFDIFQFLKGCIERQPDMTLQELQEQLREVCNTITSTVTIARTLRRRGFTQKKVSSIVNLGQQSFSSPWLQISHTAVERSEVDRANYKMLVGEHFRPGHFVFADESHFNRLTLRRSYGWAPRGSRARRRDFFIRGQKYVRDVSDAASNYSWFIIGILSCLPYLSMVSCTWRCWIILSMARNLVILLRVY